MKTALDGAEGDFEVFGDLGVAEALEVGEEENLFQGVRHAVNRFLNELVAFLILEPFAGRRDGNFHEVDECLAAGISVPIDGGGQVHFLTTNSLTEHVPGFVRGNREKPRFKASGGVEGIGGYMDLEEGFLEDIFGGLAIAGQADEEAKQVVLVALDEDSERGGIAVPVGFEQLFIGLRVQARVIRGVELGAVEVRDTTDAAVRGSSKARDWDYWEVT